ncbi:hypothetical protein EXN66_Car009465 [Channa argus]|uniref:Uncharacterized protein n=1 Tax=Channa argus TaxID=215402 RepID=A0A6G1PU83_CHAAH|nr:hypothetical protein EXN66_Car009465 [Channa argus]
MCRQTDAQFKNRPCHSGYGNFDAQVIVIDCSHKARIIINLSLPFFSLLSAMILCFFSPVYQG